MAGLKVPPRAKGAALVVEDDADVRLVTLRRYSVLPEALIARELLEAEGIFALVPDEHMVAMNWLYLNALGGIRLQVRNDDVARANEVLGSEPIIIDPGIEPNNDDETGRG